MIYFFPMPYPDELLYSVYARYNKLTRNDSYYLSIKELLGKYQDINFPFANNLEYLCNQLPNNTIYTPKYIALNHTTLPVYKAFILM